MKNKDTFSNLGYLLKQIWETDKSLYLVQFIVVLVTVTSRILYIWFPKWIIDSLSEHIYRNAIILVIVLCVSTLLLNSILNLLETVSNIRQERLKLDLNEKLARKSFSLSYEKFEEHKTREQYEFAVRCVKEDTIKTIFQNVMSIAEAIITVVGLLYITAYIPWFLWILLFVGSFVQCVCSIIRMKYNFKSYQSQNEVEMGMLYARDRMTWKSFAKEVRLFSMYQFVTNTARYYINELAEIQKERAKNNFKTLWWSFLIANIQIVVIYIFIAYQCYMKVVSIGEFTMILSAMLLFIAMINQIGNTLIGIGEQGQYIEGMRRFLEKDEMNRTKKFDEKEILNISFADVSFSYPGSDFYALKNLNLNLKMGKKYGIVGLNGSGKTTFISLLMGLYHSYTGDIRINDVSIKDIPTQELQAYFAPVMQNFGTYSYTIHENISFSEKTDIQKAEALLNKVGMSYKVQSLQNGIDTYITEEYNHTGTDLSGGEKQKIAMVRALYKDAPVFVLDEPTAALSPRSEYEFYKIFNTLMNNKTVFYISHRLASCRICDEIIVFNEGEIVEVGSHETLISKNGLYAHLFKVQAEQFEVINNE